MPTTHVFSKTLKPPLKWAGGKRWLAPKLKPLWEKHLQEYPKARLVEPFCGGLAIALGLIPSKALLNDVNPHIIAFYKNIQQGLLIQNNSFLLLNDAETYYQNRETFNQLIREQQINTNRASALFYYLNRTGFNGLCRFNQKGFFNVPFGQYKTIHYQPDFLAYKDIFANWQFTCLDFQQIVTSEEDFIYVDPPYDVPFVTYAQHGFQWQDQIRLVSWLKQQKGNIIVSNQATERILKLYEANHFDIEIIDAPRRIACNGNREYAKEILAILK